MITPGTLVTSAAADVINHNGRKISRFKPIRFCWARTTSAQSWSRRHHWSDPTSSLPIFKWLYLVIYKTLALVVPVHVYPAKSSRFESTDFAAVRINGCSRRHQCPRCGLIPNVTALKFHSHIWIEFMYQWMWIELISTDSDAIGNHTSLVQVMARSRPILCHYLNQCWFNVKAMPWDICQSNVSGNAQDSNHYMCIHDKT